MSGYRSPLAAGVCVWLLGNLLAAAAPSFGAPHAGVFANDAGESKSISLAGPIDATNPFFQPLGVNGRACVHCHQPAEGWSITPAGVRARFEATDGLDPIFRPNDGSNAPNADVSTEDARRQAYSLLLAKGLIRVGIPMPPGAEFSLVGVDDPYGFASQDELSLFRRPLPSTNIRFLSAVMWDGRFSPPGRPFNDHFLEQAQSAITGHAQAVAAPPGPVLQQIVDFQMNLFTAQCIDKQAGDLERQGGQGGPEILSLQPFHLGINDPIAPDPSGAPSTSEAFSLFRSWKALTGVGHWKEARRAMARGETLFNSKRFTVSGVSGLNDELGVPSLAATCTTCHNTPGSGNHSMPRPLNIGLADAARRTPDMPLYTLQNGATGETIQTTDPGRALVTGKWKDIGRFKGPVLRGLAARAPYFHNGFAVSLGEAVDFYDSRFNIGLTPQEKSDLVAFMRAL